MSASPLKADNLHTISASPLSANSDLTHRNKRHVCWAKRVSVDDLVRSHHHFRRYCQTECFECLFVNHETEVSWLLKREVGRTRSLQDSVGKVCRAIVHSVHIWAVRHQPAVANQEIIFVNRRQLVFGSKLKDSFAVEPSQGIRNHQDGIGTVAYHRVKRGSEVLRLTHAKWLYLET